MIAPANADSQQVTTVDSESKDLNTRISEALTRTDENGKLQFEENTDPTFKAAVQATHDARFFQKDFTRSKQEIAALKATQGVLEQQITSTSVALPAEQITELEDLKFTDPDSYFIKRTQYEEQASQATMTRVKEKTAKAIQDQTIVERGQTLQEFTQRTGIVITDEVLKSDIPPRLYNKINDMPFEDYLNEVAEYLNKSKVVKQTDEGLGGTDISKLAGSGDTNKGKAQGYQII